MRTIFWTVFSPQEPAFTVKSLAMTQTGRPSTVPTPVTTPSAGVSGSAERARSQSSWNSVPGSRSRLRRSRTKSLPSARILSRYLTCPCWTRAISSRRRRSLTPGMVARGSVATPAWDDGPLLLARADRDDQDADLAALDPHQDPHDRPAHRERLDLHLAAAREREALEHADGHPRLDGAHRLVLRVLEHFPEPRHPQLEPDRLTAAALELRRRQAGLGRGIR